MSNFTKNYNRDKNIDGPIYPANFVPEYGSTVSFENKNVHFYTADNYYKKFSKGVNGTKIKFDLKFSNKTEEEARSFLSFIEQVINSNNGSFDFNYLSYSGVEIDFPTGEIYKNIKELLIEDYNFKFHNGLFDIDLKLSKNGYSSLFEWMGSSYLNTGNFNNAWVDGTAYKKFDVLYFPYYKESNIPYFETGNYYKLADRREKFYYCSSGHIANNSNNPTGENSAWTRSFFYEPDDDLSISTDRSSTILEMKDSFNSFIKINENGGLIKDLKLSYKNRSNKEARSIIHFLEKHEDYKPFNLNIPQLYSKEKNFVAKSFDHKFVYKDCNDINITVDEVFFIKNPDLFDNYQAQGSSIADSFWRYEAFLFGGESVSVKMVTESSTKSLIDWGDGSFDYLNNGAVYSHTYQGQSYDNLNVTVTSELLNSFTSLTTGDKNPYSFFEGSYWTGNAVKYRFGGEFDLTKSVKLKTFSVLQHDISSVIGAFELPLLENINLSWNLLSGSLDTYLPPNIVTFSAPTNFIKSRIPNEAHTFSRYQSLNYINVAHNNISGSLFDFGNSIEVVDIGDNFFTGNLIGLQNYQSLRIFSAYINNFQIQSNWNVPSTMKTLRLASNNLTSAEVDTVLTKMNNLNTSGPNASIFVEGNAPPTSIGLSAIQQLSGRGWNVSYS